LESDGGRQGERERGRERGRRRREGGKQRARIVALAELGESMPSVAAGPSPILAGRSQRGSLPRSRRDAVEGHARMGVATLNRFSSFGSLRDPLAQSPEVDRATLADERLL